MNTVQAAPTILVFEHSKSTSKEGWQMVLRVIAVVVPLALAPLLFPPKPVFNTFWYLILILVSTLGVFYAISNIKSKGSFVCRLTTQQLTQIVPAHGCGDNFEIPLSEITQIERYDDDKDPYDWYVHTISGRFKITPNYGNPIEDFVDYLRQLLPDVPMIETGIRAK